MCKYNKNKFSKALTLSLVALMLSSLSYAQKPLKGFQVGYKVEGRDTVYQIKLRDTYLFSWPEAKKKGRAWRDFYRLVYNFRKTYPYALIAKEKFGIADSVLNSRKFTSKQKTKYIKDFEIFYQTQFIENPEKYESLNELKRALPQMEYHELRVLRDYFTDFKK